MVDLGDVVALVGLGLVAYGAYVIYPPAAFIVPGVVFFLVGVMWRGGKRQPAQERAGGG